jgi:ABC-type oligopeptide transport system substrate-binding subunit
MKSLKSALLILLATTSLVAFAQSGYTQYGNQRQYNNGVTATQYGNQTQYSNGVTATQYGNQTQYSNGRNCTQYGNQVTCN